MEDDKSAVYSYQYNYNNAYHVVLLFYEQSSYAANEPFLSASA